MAGKDSWTVTWLEVALVAILVLSGLAIQSLASHFVEKGLRDEQPSLGSVEQTTGPIAAKDSLARSELERKLVREKWAKERLVFLEQSVLMEKLEQQHPALRSEQVKDTPQEALRAHQQAVARRELSKTLLKRLGGRLGHLSRRVRVFRMKVQNVERRTTDALNRKTRRLQCRKLKQELIYTSIGVILLLAAARLLMRRAVDVSSSMRYRRVAGATLVILAIIIVSGILGLATATLLTALIAAPILTKLAARTPS